MGARETAWQIGLGLRGAEGEVLVGGWNMESYDGGRGMRAEPGAGRHHLVSGVVPADIWLAVPHWSVVQEWLQEK